MTEPVEKLSPGEEDRRAFLKSCGRFALTVPPAMTVLLSTSLSSPAIAHSTGGRRKGGWHKGWGKGHHKGHKGNRRGAHKKR